MLAQRHMHLEWEIVKWIAILALASALAIAVAGTLARGEEPARLPPTIDEWAVPMGIEQPGEPPVPVEDVPMKLWMLLADQQAGRFDRVVENWRYLPLAHEGEVWRNVALAQALIAMGDLQAAADALDTAVAINPENAVVHYYLGILHLEQADRASKWYDPAMPPAMRLASIIAPAGGPAQVAPNTRDMYHLAAMLELEAAIELAPSVILDEPLAPPEWPTASALPPTVGDLLLALGADRFDAKAHNMLGYLYVEYGAAEMAEQHLDAAADSGVVVVFGYDDLGALYETEGRHLDAFRAFAKSAAQGNGIVRPLGKMLENLREAFIDP
jgi:tetratricopeptide (TPR) repeat protein